MATTSSHWNQNSLSESTDVDVVLAYFLNVFADWLASIFCSVGGSGDNALA